MIPSSTEAAGSRSERLATIEEGRRVLRTEARALADLEQRLDDDFARAVEAIIASDGRVIVSGVGKSGIIARKIAATLTSTGTPATFLHPVEALHGDLGVVRAEDVALLLSKSGETDELRGLVEFFSRMGVQLIAMTGRRDSTLGRRAAFVIDCGVNEEACPHDLAPTSSTTAAMAVGDALAVALLKRRGFGAEDFARLHPGGALGRRLLVRVADVMVSEDVPILPPGATMRQAVVLLAEKRGTIAVADEHDVLIGVLTSGDLTRLMEKRESFLDVAVSEIMNRDPKWIGPDELGAAAVGVMERHGIMALPVLDDHRRVIGMVHLHDLMRAGAI